MRTRVLTVGFLLIAGFVRAQVNGQYVLWVNGAPQGGGTGTTDHALLTHLDYASALHTGFAPLANATFTGNTTATVFRLFDGGTHYTIFQAQTQGANYTYTLPALGNVSGTLTNDGAGNLTWEAPVGTGANTELSNLGTVAINSTLDPYADAAIDLNSFNLRYSNAFFSTALYSPIFTTISPTTNDAPSALLLKSADAWPGASGGNTTGANTIIAGGIGKRIFTVVAYNNGTMAGSTVTITVNGTAHVLTEGVAADWRSITSNGATAISLTAAIDALAGVSAVAATNDVRITPDAGTYSLTITKTADNAGMTATSGADGVMLIPDGSYVAPSIAFASAPSCGLYLSGGGVVFGGANLAALVFTTQGYEVWTYNSGFDFGSAFHLTWGPNAVHGSPDIGIKRNGINEVIVTNGSSGNGNVVASTAITAVGTAAANGYIRTGVYKRTWANAEVIALDPGGTLLTVDLKVATLPAKTIVRNAYLVIDSQAAGVTTLTVSLGRTATTYLDYIVASNAMVAANTVYGDVSGERGTSLTGYDLASYTAPVDVYLQFIATDAAKHIADVTSCNGTIFLLTENLP